LTLFILACAGLVLLSGLFLLFPRKLSGTVDEDLERANVQWYRQRQAELAAENAADLEEDARLRLLEDEQIAQNAVKHSGSQGFPVWTLLPVVALLAGLLYYELGAAPDVLISRQLQSLGQDSDPDKMEALMNAIEARSAARPDNLDYRALLGRFYMAREEYHRAARTYSELARELPGDAFALASAAQAEYLAAGRKLSSEARLQAEQSLAIDPHQRTALGLLGMASFEEQQYRAAIDYWQRLLAVEQPGSANAQMINGVIDMARQRLVAAGDMNEEEAVAAAAPAAGSGAGVTVQVALPEGASVGPGDTVFVLARNANATSRMPIAVQRLPASQLPLTLRLDDSNSMAGQKLSAAESVVVVVQVSPNGTPGEASATWLGKAGPLAPSADQTPVEILLQPRS
jgi:cytochrome c-type biogenesis protein CcmH